MVKRLANIKYIASQLLYLLVFLLPLQTRWIAVDSAIQFQQISLYGFDILAICLILVCFFIKQGGEGLSKRSLIALLGLIVIWAVIGLFWSADPRLSSYWILRLVVVLGVVWAAKVIDFNPRKLAWNLAIAVTLQALLGIGQFILQDNIVSSKWLGAAEQQAGNLGTSVIESTDTRIDIIAQSTNSQLGWSQPGRWLRAHGTQPHPNVLGGLLLIGLAMAYYLKTESYKPLPLARSILAFHSTLLSAMLLLMAAGLFFTFSRSAWLVALLLFLSILVNNRFRFGKRQVRVILPAVIMVITMAVTYSPLVLSRLNLGPRLEQQSVTQRLGQIEQAQNVLKNNLVTGAGLGNYTNTLRQVYPDLPAHEIQPVHNVFLLIISEIGFIGLAIFMLIIHQTIKQYDSRDAIFLSVFIGLLVIGLFDHYIWTLPSFVYLFWLVTGLVYYRRLQ